MRLLQVVSHATLKYVHVKDVTFWFSYAELIGVTKGDSTIIAINEWSKTTAKHLNYIKSREYVSLEVPHNELLDYVDTLITI